MYMYKMLFATRTKGMARRLLLLLLLVGLGAVASVAADKTIKVTGKLGSMDLFLRSTNIKPRNRKVTFIVVTKGADGGTISSRERVFEFGDGLANATASFDEVLGADEFLRLAYQADKAIMLSYDQDSGNAGWHFVAVDAGTGDMGEAGGPATGKFSFKATRPQNGGDVLFDLEWKVSLSESGGSSSGGGDVTKPVTPPATVPAEDPDGDGGGTGKDGGTGTGDGDGDGGGGSGGGSGSGSGGSVGAIAGAIVGVLLLVGVVAAFVVARRRRQRKLDDGTGASSCKLHAANEAHLLTGDSLALMDQQNGGGGGTHVAVGHGANVRASTEYAVYSETYGYEEAPGPAAASAAAAGRDVDEDEAYYDANEGQLEYTEEEYYTAVLYDQAVPKVESLVIEHSTLTLGRTLGQGAFGKVMLGHMARRGGIAALPVAVKTLKIDGDAAAASQGFSEMTKEAKTMMAIPAHECVVRILAITETPPIYLITELLPLGDLKAYLRKQDSETVPSTVLRRFAWQTARGLAHLASHKLVHRDVAARNVLVADSNTCKIADFGLSRVVDTLYGGSDIYQQSSDCKVAIRWTAPEALTMRRYSTASDVWSWGVLLYEIYSRGTVRPYSVEQVTNRDLVAFLNTGRRLGRPAEMPAWVFELAQRCWAAEPAARPAFAELVNVIEARMKKKQ